MYSAAVGHKIVVADYDCFPFARILVLDDSSVILIYRCRSTFVPNRLNDESQLRGEN